jgi:predicted  nucleic acid-binding Zn-ribbon protein
MFPLSARVRTHLGTHACPVIDKPMPLASGFFCLPTAYQPSAKEKSPMPRRTKLLYTLQRIDTQLARKKHRYREVEAHLGESETLKVARAASKEADKELAHWRSVLRDQELETAGVTEKLQVTEKQLYGGRITNPKELSDLQKEVEYLKRRKASLEEKQIEEMVNVEQLVAKAQEAKTAYEQAEAAWRSENAELSAEYDELRAALAKLLAQRKTVIKHISEKDLAEYNALRRIFKGLAVVAVKDGSCRSCHVEVPRHDLEQAQATDEIYYCSGCERILYVPEE